MNSRLGCRKTIVKLCHAGIDIFLTLFTASPSLTLRSSPGQGMHIHIGRAKRDAAKIRDDPVFIPMSSSGTTSTFFHRVRPDHSSIFAHNLHDVQDWSQLGNRMIELSGAISEAEKAAFEILRDDVRDILASIGSNSNDTRSMPMQPISAKTPELWTRSTSRSDMPIWQQNSSWSDLSSLKSR